MILQNIVLVYRLATLERQLAEEMNRQKDEVTLASSQQELISSLRSQLEREACSVQFLPTCKTY